MFGSLGQHLGIFSSLIHLASLLKYHQAVKSLASIRCIYVSVTVSLLPPPPGLDLTFVLLALSPVVWPEWERRTGDCCWRSASLLLLRWKANAAEADSCQDTFGSGLDLETIHKMLSINMYFTSKSHLNVMKKNKASQANANTNFHSLCSFPMGSTHRILNSSH